MDTTTREPADDLRVLHAIDPGPAGGAETVVRRLASLQHRRGLAVRVAIGLTGSGEDGTREDHPLRRTLARDGVPVSARRVPGRAYLSELAFLRAECRDFGADVLHTHGYRSDVLGALAAVGTGAARVSTLHGFTGGGRRNRAYEWLQCRAAARADRVVAVSRPLAASLEARGVPAGRIEVIRNAWTPGETASREEARRTLGLPERGFVAGWVGRLSREKGPDVLLEALGHLEEPPEVSVLGTGALAAPLRERARGAGLPVRWHGVVPDAGRLFPAFDLFVLSSRTEGTPMALLEAIAAGVPVVATEVGGVPDVVDGDSAILVPPEDPAALAAAIEAVVADPAAAARRAERARSDLEAAHDPDAWERAYRRVYAAALGGRGGRS